MTGYQGVLVVAATERELAPSGGWSSVVCGVGPVDAAATTAAAILRHHPRVILHVGIAGARRATSLMPPELVVGTESLYADLGVPEAWAPHHLTAPPGLVAAVMRAIPAAMPCRIGTSGRVGQSSDCEVEAMEGFAVLRAAALAGVPAIEVRAISNTVEESDRARWQLAAAFEAIVAATPALVEQVAAWTR